MLESSVQSAYHDFSSLAQLRAQASIEPNAAAHEVAQQFESIFVGFMLKAMRQATPEDSLFSSDSMRSYQQMFDSQLALSLADQGGIGLAPLIEKQIAASGGVATNPNTTAADT